MTPEHADILAKRIVNCWRGGPPVTEWRDALLRLASHEQARQVIDHLRDTQSHVPTIAQFRGEYHRLSMRTEHTVTELAPQARPLGPAQYLERLRLRAAKGDPDAEQELADWERIHPRPTFGRSFLADRESYRLIAEQPKET